MLPKGPACTMTGCPSVVCTRFGRMACRSSDISEPTAFNVRPPSPARSSSVYPIDDPAQPLPQVVQVACSAPAPP